MKLFVWKCPECSELAVYPHGSVMLDDKNNPKACKVPCSNETCFKSTYRSQLDGLDFLGVWVPEGGVRRVSGALRKQLETFIEPWGELDRMVGAAGLVEKEIKALLKCGEKS